MTRHHPIYHAPADAGRLILGQTLPDLLDEGCDRYPNLTALNQWQKRSWQTVSNTEFRTAAEELAIGLRNLGLQKGDRVALVMNSDLSFCLADMGCLLAGLVNVPIDLTQTIENIIFILQQSEAKALIIANLNLLQELLPYFPQTPLLTRIVVANVPSDWDQVRQEWVRLRAGAGASLFSDEPLEECLQLPALLCAQSHEGFCPRPSLPQCIQIESLNEIQAQGQAEWSVEMGQQFRRAIDPRDLATIIYIPSEAKQPKGVMLTHEAIAANILSAFSSYPDLGTGSQEIALLFLPLTHIFARSFFYGHLAYGHTVYFSDPNHLIKHLQLVQPTILITVPRLLEKISDRILEKGRRLQGWKQVVFHWALGVAQRYQLGQSPNPIDALQLKIADRWVFSQWRTIFGSRLKALISGGAMLRSELANLFSAAGIPIFQGYGLTETSGVVCYNRGLYNRAGTVGVPIPGVKLAIAEDGEILIQSPFVMEGYYRETSETDQVIDPEGWFHTGDIGTITTEGLLKITGVKKSLFKLATGKYVSPAPLESDLHQSHLIDHAVTIGANQKFCAMLIFPNWATLQHQAQKLGVDQTRIDWFLHPCIQAMYQALIDSANCHLPYWSTVRKFRLIPTVLTIESGLLQANGTLDRARVLQHFAQEIDDLYRNSGDLEMVRDPEGGVCLDVPPYACPTYAQSLTHA